MGRYANFNTGFEYKFVFAIQPSDDIKEFGGEVNNSDDEEYNYYYTGHVWTEQDKDTILSILKNFGEGFRVPDFSNYECSVIGTTSLYEDFYDSSNKNNRSPKFILGCLIYHQLLYEPDLSVQYEL